jgi:hypothetical protein
LAKSDIPRALTHMSTGVVYASPGVVNIPPCVLSIVNRKHVNTYNKYVAQTAKMNGANPQKKKKVHGAIEKEKNIA